MTSLPLQNNEKYIQDITLSPNPVKLSAVLIVLFVLLLISAIIMKIDVGIMYLIFILAFIAFGIYSAKRRYVVTSKRIYAKKGKFGDEYSSIDTSRIKSIYVQQSIIGRLFNYGNLICQLETDVIFKIFPVKNPKNTQATLNTIINNND